MTAYRVLARGIAAVGVCCMVLAGGAANADITGRVIAPDLSGIYHAHVEAWGNYPDGAKTAAAVFTDLNGGFSLSGLSPGSYDIRVWMGDGSYYPSVVFDVSASYSGLLFVVVVPTPSVFVGLYFCDFSDSALNSTYLGYPIQRGDLIGVRDPNGVWCGIGTYYEMGLEGLYLVHVYGDQNIPPGVDEGAVDGDTLQFFINNKPARLLDVAGTWSNTAKFLSRLEGLTTDIEGVTITPPPDGYPSPGETFGLQFKITNTGNHTDSYDLLPISESGWMVQLPGGAASGTLDSAESKTITVSVTVPADAQIDAIDQVYLFATSKSNDAVMGVNRGTVLVKPTGIVEEETIPQRFYLAQNFPNPFNPSTMIAFGLETGGQTTITVYNLLGQSVAVLLDEYRLAGRHTAVWDGKDRSGRIAPTGIYFYRIQSGAFAETRKMVLMK